MMITKEFLNEKYRDLFDLADDLIKNSIDDFSGESLNLSKVIVYTHYTRAILLLESIYILCSEGYALGAASSLRSLINLLINLKWLKNKDSQNRMQKYADYEFVYKKKLIDIVSRLGLNPEELLGLKEEDLISEYNRVYAKYKIYDYRKKKYILNLSWSGKSISQMAQEVGLEKRYLEYFLFSGMEHTGPESPSFHLDISSDNELIPKIGPRDEDIPEFLLTAFQCFLSVKEAAIDEFGLAEDQFEGVYREYNTLRNKYDSDETQS